MFKFSVIIRQAGCFHFIPFRYYLRTYKTTANFGYDISSDKLSNASQTKVQDILDPDND